MSFWSGRDVPDDVRRSLSDDRILNTPVGVVVARIEGSFVGTVPEGALLFPRDTPAVLAAHRARVRREGRIFAVSEQRIYTYRTDALEELAVALIVQFAQESAPGLWQSTGLPGANSLRNTHSRTALMAFQGLRVPLLGKAPSVLRLASLLTTFRDDSALVSDCYRCTRGCACVYNPPGHDNELCGCGGVLIRQADKACCGD